MRNEARFQHIPVYSSHFLYIASFAGRDQTTTLFTDWKQKGRAWDITRPLLFKVHIQRQWDM